MNEEALQDAYTLFQQGGYTKSFDEFVTLINTNDEAPPRCLHFVY